MRIGRLFLAFLLFPAAEAGAQDLPVAEPGGIVTVTLDPPSALTSARDSSGVLTLAWALETAGGVRAIGRQRGSFTWEAGERPRFPVTLRVPDRAEAGERDLAIVAFESADRKVGSVPVRVRVLARRQLEVQLVSGTEAAQRGDPVTFTYVLRNRGNAGDSVALSLETNFGEPMGAVPPSVWLAPYEEKSEAFDLSVPPDATVGSEMYVRLSARLAGKSVTDHATLVVLEERGLFPDLVQIPSTVFLGSTVTGADGTPRTRPVVAIRGNGRMGRNTELLFNYLYTPRGGSVFAFRGLLSGPRLFIGIERPDWSASAGDLNIRTSDLLGYQLQGRGAQAAWHRSGLSVQGLAARPTGLDGSTLDGHVAAAEIGFGSETARGGFLGVSTERSDGNGTPESSVRSAVGRFHGSRGRHWLGVDAGPMRVANLRTRETETGPSVDARYAYRGPRTDVDLVFRKLPDLLSDPRLPPSEMRATGTLRPVEPLSLSGTVYDEEVPRSLQFAGSRARGARAGLRWGESNWTVGLTGDFRRVRGVVDETRRLGRVDATVRRGDFTFDGSLGLGTTQIGEAAELAELYRLGGSWLAERGMVSFHVTVSDDILQPTSTLLDANGLYRLSEVVELYGSATTYVILESEGFAPRSISDGLTVQTGARLRLSPSRFLYAGIERFSPGGSDAARWRLSVGVRQGLPVPLPLRRPPAASGVVYEDLNGDGQRGEGEPGLDGVMLRMGFERTVSLPDGRFEFRDADPGVIEVDPRSLAGGFVPVSDFRVPPDGDVEIGLYRAGGLRVMLFLDANDDGVWDEDELPASGISVAVTRGEEPWVLKTSADGSVSLSSLAPGTYVIRVDAETLPSRALPAGIQTAEVKGGETTAVRIAIPMRQINFSRFGEAAGPCDDPQGYCNDD